MPLISSGTLFHFTNSIENLIGILLYEFRPRLCVETFRYVTQHVAGADLIPDCAIPMVCFCDIPLSQVARHMDTYGDYGLGLTKSWGISRGISPVTYVHEHSPAPQSTAQLIHLMKELNERSIPEELLQLGLSAGQLVYYLKPYQGEVARAGKPCQSVRFYDEREWRYIPPDIESIPAISPTELSDPVASQEARKLVDQLPPLSFEPHDINYVVVKSEDELLPMYYQLRAIKAKYSPAEVDRLVTKLVSAERIRADF